MSQNNTSGMDPVLEAKRAQVAKDVERIISEGGFQLFPFIEHTQNGALIPRVTIVPTPETPTELPKAESAKENVETEVKES